MTAGHFECHCRQYRNGNNGDHHINGKSHASACRAAPALYGPSAAPTQALLQPPPPVPLPELAALAVELQVLKLRVGGGW